MKRVLVLLALATLAASVTLAAPPTVPELLRGVPASAQVVVALDGAALRSHPIVQDWLLRQHATWGSANDEAARFLADAGFDPLRDVDAMVLAISSEGTSGRAVAFFAGRFDPTSLGAALTKRGATPFAIGNVAAYHLPEGEHHGEPSVLAQPSADLLLVGDEPAVKTALTATNSGNSLIEKAIAAGHIDPRAPFWVVAAIPPHARQQAAQTAERMHDGGSEPVREVVLASGAVQWVAIQAFLDDTLHLSAAAVVDTPENAELLRDAAKGAMAAARLQAQDRAPELVNVLRDVQVRASGTDVTAAGAVPLALLEKLAADHSHTRGSAVGK